MPKKNSLILYFIIAFLIPIVATTIITLKEGLSADIAVVNVSTITLVIIMAMVHAPTIAAIIAAYQEQGFSGVKNLFRQLKYWKFAPKWYFKALFIFPLTIIGTSLILALFSPNYTPVLNLTLLTFGTLLSAFWEEIGWTGYATPRLLAKFSPLKVGLFFGLIHALWHLPADFWGSSVFHGDFFFIHYLVTGLGIVVLRIVSVWIYTQTKSLVLGWITHASFTTGQLLFVSLALTAKETIIWQTAFSCSLILVAIFIFAKKRDLNSNNIYKQPQ